MNPIPRRIYTEEFKRAAIKLVTEQKLSEMRVAGRDDGYPCPLISTQRNHPMSRTQRLLDLIQIEREPGYLLRPGFMLPPLLFSEEESEALVLGVGHGNDLKPQARLSR